MVTHNDTLNSFPLSVDYPQQFEGGREKAQKRDRQRTYASILDEAQKAFSSSPYSEVSLKEIAQKAGISPTLIIKYFGSKEKLYAEQLDFGYVATVISEAEWTTLGEHMVRAILESPREDPNSFIHLLAAGAGSITSAHTLGKKFEKYAICTLENKILTHADNLRTESPDSQRKDDQQGIYLPDARCRAEAAISVACGLSIISRLVSQDFFLQNHNTHSQLFYSSMIQGIVEGRPFFPCNPPNIEAQ